MLSQKTKTFLQIKNCYSFINPLQSQVIQNTCTVAQKKENKPTCSSSVILGRV